MTENFRFIACKVDNWNRDLSPWEAPVVIGKEDFSNGAANTLIEILKLCEDRAKTYYNTDQDILQALEAKQKKTAIHKSRSNRVTGELFRDLKKFPIYIDKSEKIC